MKRISASILTMIFVLVAVSSCKKEGPAIIDSPSITIWTPIAGQSFSTGGTLRITGNAAASATDDAHLLHELSLTVKKDADNSVLWNAVISVHDEQSHNFDTSIVLPSVSASVNYTLQAEVVNHLEKSATSEKHFSVNP